MHVSGTQTEKQQEFFVTWHVLQVPFMLLRTPQSPPPPQSVLQVYPTSCFLLFFLQKVPREHSPAASSKAEKYNMQNFAKIQSFGTAGNEGGLSGRIVWSTAYRYMTIYQLFFRASQFKQAIRKRMSHPTVVGFLFKHFSRQQLWSKPVEFYPSPILLQWCTDTHHPTRVWHLLIASNVDARESGRLLLVKLSDLLSKQSRKPCIACSAVQVSPTPLSLHEETSISIH